MQLFIRRSLVVSSVILTCAMPACKKSEEGGKGSDSSAPLDTRLSVTDYEEALVTVCARSSSPIHELDSLRRALYLAEHDGGVPEDMLEHIAAELRRTGLTCDARFRTFRDGELVHGAVVKYRLITNEGPPDRVHGLTSENAQETLDIGFYHVWAERDDEPTSSTTEQFNILYKQSVIDLVENR